MRRNWALEPSPLSYILSAFALPLLDSTASCFYAKMALVKCQIFVLATFNVALEGNDFIACQ